jgi:hypothetical protein
MGRRCSNIYHSQIPSNLMERERPFKLHVPSTIKPLLQGRLNKSTRLSYLCSMLDPMARHEFEVVAGVFMSEGGILEFQRGWHLGKFGFWLQHFNHDLVSDYVANSELLRLLGSVNLCPGTICERFISLCYFILSSLQLVFEACSFGETGVSFLVPLISKSHKLWRWFLTCKI